MNILLHTLALEPARWTQEQVSRPLAELLPTIAGAGFYKLEIFEPHLSLLPDEPAMVPLFQRYHLVPMVLSSHLELSPDGYSEDTFQMQAAELFTRIDLFGFQKVRLSPGRSPSADDFSATIKTVAARVRYLAEQQPQTEFLLETHGGSLADDPASMVALVEAAARPNVGLLWQPTVFEVDAALAQWQLQQPFVRHFHLQNRDAAGRFRRLTAGVIPWEDILSSASFGHDVTLELVPSGVCLVETFDLATSVQEAVEEFAAIVKLES